MKKETPSRREDEGMNNTEHRIDRVRVAGLHDMTAAGTRLPSRREITAPKRPPAISSFHFYITIGIDTGTIDGIMQLDFQFEVRRGTWRYKAFVALLQHLTERCVVGAQQYWYSADFYQHAAFGN